MTTSTFWRQLLHDFARMRNVRELMDEREQIEWFDESSQESLLHSVLLHEHIQKFPISMTYTVQFLKAYMQRIENHGLAVHDDLMSHFMECLAQKPKLREEGPI
eukprot:c8446_g1_i2.p1 GENE.c8446_g1_i2~~c8446_g1_i2.p1  ORF type:complete len:104 (+),score=11.19 c8446_g1_i2:3-314(+)